MENDYQLAINRMGRATMGTFQTTPLGIVIAESKLTPAKPLLDYRQAKFMQRLMARPKGHQGPEEILERRGAQLTERLRQVSFLRSEDRPEELCWARHHAFPGCIQIKESQTAYQTAKECTDKRNSV